MGGRPAAAGSRRERAFDWSKLRPRSLPADPSGAADVVPGLVTDDQPPDTSRETRVRLPATDDRAAVTLTLRVNDLKQFAYCPRIVFYQYTMPVQHKPTFKMEHGKAVEGIIERLESRRQLREYGLAEGTREFQVWLSSPRLGLSGRLDLMITTQRGVFPVDFKDTLDRVHHNHHVQLCAYALLIEDVLARPVPAGFVYRVPRNDMVIVEITAELREETHRHIEAIRQMIVEERMPPPTARRARCTDCEYRNYCGDVF
jgi:CRISPR-associated exonuclease Cas4